MPLFSCQIADTIITAEASPATRLRCIRWCCSPLAGCWCCRHADAMSGHSYAITLPSLAAESYAIATLRCHTWPLHCCCCRYCCATAAAMLLIIAGHYAPLLYWCHYHWFSLRYTAVSPLILLLLSCLLHTHAAIMPLLPLLLRRHADCCHGCAVIITACHYWYYITLFRHWDAVTNTAPLLSFSPYYDYWFSPAMLRLLLFMLPLRRWLLRHFRCQLIITPLIRLRLAIILPHCYYAAMPWCCWCVYVIAVVSISASWCHAAFIIFASQAMPHAELIASHRLSPRLMYAAIGCLRRPHGHCHCQHCTWYASHYCWWWLPRLFHYWYWYYLDILQPPAVIAFQMLMPLRLSIRPAAAFSRRFSPSADTISPAIGASQIADANGYASCLLPLITPLPLLRWFAASYAAIDIDAGFHSHYHYFRCRLTMPMSPALRHVDFIVIVLPLAASLGHYWPLITCRLLLMLLPLLRYQLILAAAAACCIWPLFIASAAA